MGFKRYSWNIFWHIFFGLFLKTHLTLHDSGHGFISKNPIYFDDDLTHIHQEIYSIRYSANQQEVPMRIHLRFEPEFLDFGERSLGVTHSETVKLFNMDSNKTVDMTSVSGNTIHFHSSFFEDKRVPPNGNTTFKVVFLGRHEGRIESNLFIHTSEGYIKYPVKATGTFSGYRLRPIVGIKLPVNTVFTPLIYMHNPHSHPIQIVEVYSSGGGFHLELPSGDHEGPNDIWEILPQETKAVVRVRFEAGSIQNHSAYVRIKLHKPDEILIVPLEVEVTQAVSLFHPQGHIDFGIGGDMDGQREVVLCLSNPSQKPIRVHSVSTTSKSIKVLYYNVRIMQREQHNFCAQVGSLTVDWKTAWKLKDFHGKIIVKFRNGKNRTEIPYFLSVLKGGLSFDNMATSYFLNDKDVDATLRNFEAKNEFHFPLKVTNITFPTDAHTFFKIETFTPKLIDARTKEILFNIKLKSNIRKSDIQLSSSIKIHTNVSDVTVPLLSYNGKLQVRVPFKTEDEIGLDAGLIDINTKKEYFLVLSNPNPVSLYVTRLSSSIPMTHVELFGCGQGDIKMVMVNNDFKNLTKCHSVRSKQFAVIRVLVTTSNIEGQIWGDIQIESPFENLSIPVRIKIAPGRLEIDSENIIFDDCFPGKLCTVPLKIYSTFNDKMAIQQILSPTDKRISFALENNGIILPKNLRTVGQLIFTPHLECAPKCYTGLHTDTSASWLQSFAISKHVSQYDLNLVNTFYNRFLNVTTNGIKEWHNVSFRLVTSEVKGHMFTGKVKMSWPRIVLVKSWKNKSVLQFPLCQIGNFTYVSMALYNPANYNLAVQLVLDKDYPELDILRLGLPPDLLPIAENDELTHKHTFFLEEVERTKQQHFFSENLNVKVHKDTLPILLSPNETKRVIIGYYAETANLSTALLLLRNNLTILEVIKVSAKGVLPLLKFGNRSPGASQPLKFEMTEKHMKDCERQKDLENPQPNLTVKRTFTARNMGEVKIYIHAFLINDHMCESYGFKVLDCEPFSLAPNETKRITIAFTPDLTLTKVTRMLILRTSLNAHVNYTLIASIPFAHLQLCADILPRPYWEPYLNMVSVILLFFVFFAITMIAIIDAHRIRRQAIEAFLTSNAPNVQPVLDLRKVGQQTREEIQSPIKEKSKELEEQESQDKKVDGNKTKIEPAIVPTTGTKTKRRQICGEDEDDEYNHFKTERERKTKKKEILFQKHRLRSRERRAVKEQQVLIDKIKKDKMKNCKDAEIKKANFDSKNKAKHIAQEEETSSTTTESSSTGSCTAEDLDNCRNNSHANSPCEFKNQEHEDLEHETRNNSVSKHGNVLNSTNQSRKFKIRRNKKQLDKENEQYIAERLDEKLSPYRNQNIHHIQTKEAKKRESKLRERKEKLIFRNKNERKLAKMSSEDNKEHQQKDSNPSFFVPLPNVVSPSSIWDENKAKFSDVVARSEPHADNSIFSTLLRPLTTTSNNLSSKPTMYVEPYKPAELGPIGSKRISNKGVELSRGCDTSFSWFDSPNNDISGDLVHDPTLNDSSVIAAISGNTVLSGTGLYRSRQELRENSLLSELASSADNWNRQPDILNSLLDGDYANHKAAPTSTSSRMEDPWNENLLNTSAYWNNSLNDIVPSSLASTSSTSSYLWGSNPVWQPWKPSDAPSTPRRTPPGFKEIVPNKGNEAQEDQTKESYRPFGSATNTWPPQQNTIWKYEGSQ